MFSIIVPHFSYRCQLGMNPAVQNPVLDFDDRGFEIELKLGAREFAQVEVVFEQLRWDKDTSFAGVEYLRISRREFYKINSIRSTLQTKVVFTKREPFVQLELVCTRGRDLRINSSKLIRPICFVCTKCGNATPFLEEWHTLDGEYSNERHRCSVCSLRLGTPKEVPSGSFVTPFDPHPALDRNNTRCSKCFYNAMADRLPALESLRTLRI